MNRLKKILLLLIMLLSLDTGYSQTYRVLKSSLENITIEFNFIGSYKIRDTVISGKKCQKILGKSYPLRVAGEPLLPAFYVNIGVPINSSPQIRIISIDKSVIQNQFIIPMPSEVTSLKPLSIINFNENIYSKNNLYPSMAAEIIDNYFYRYANIITLNASPFQFNPISRELVFNKTIIVEVSYNDCVPLAQAANKVNDPFTLEFVRSSLVNKQEAINWIGQNSSSLISKMDTSRKYWKDPQKSYYQFYLKNEGIYRIYYEQLSAFGFSSNNISNSKLELLNNGKQVPIYITDNNDDGIFNGSDYFEFVGLPPKPTPYAEYNIYNNENIYFFSNEGDSNCLRYTEKNGIPHEWDYTYQTNYTKIHYERDSLFESLGYAGDDRRDFWLWDNISGQNGSVQHSFEYHFNGLKGINPDSTQIRIKMQLQGLTTNSGCPSDHKAFLSVTNQQIGSISWSGQTTANFEKTISLNKNGIQLYPTGNIMQVQVNGDVCDINSIDEVAVNWFDIFYWRDNRAETNHIEFSSAPNVKGRIRYWTWQFLRDSIKIFIPQKNTIIKNTLVSHDQYNSIFFVDSVSYPVDYYCVGYDYFLSPDSIVKPVYSDLRNASNAADYIIIAHPNFKSVAERLASYRVNNFPDVSITNPRVKIVYTNQIYNEFSNGLLDPYAIKNFISYAFSNWTKPSPAYVVLLGDMSHDYRHLLSTSRQSFVPSLPYYSRTIGESISDNLLVAVNDSIHPDLAIGRLSCESVEEGNTLVDKIINYAQDNSKSWKQNILLLSSGLSQEDEDNLHLNDASVKLEKSYVLPNGFNSTKVMRYPNLPEYSKFQGGGPEIRNNINEGAAIINYFGHGGGYQWDLTFINDDIYLLNNIDRLPVILSLTCYTAHFDDQDVFGEQFNKIPRKGSVGFLGNVGLTYWSVGSYIDNLIFDEIFNKKNLITGKIFQYAKAVLPAVGYNNSQIALITYLGDPVLKLALPDKADFRISSSQISFGTMNPVVNDTLPIKIVIKNLGTLFSSDSVTVQLYLESLDSLYLLGEKKLGSFSIEDSTYFTWIPRYAGTYSFTVKVNEINLIPEMDHSDNTAKSTIVVYNLSYPSIISPIDGFTSLDSFVEFKMADIGYFISQPKKYLIQIDSNINFTNPVCSSSIEPSLGLVLWKSPPLKKGIYFWRSRIYSSLDSSSWSIPRTFYTLTSNRNGYYAEGKQLGLCSTYNMNISDSGLTLNKNYLLPKPSNKNIIGNITIDPSIIDSTGMTSITTDGSYIYCGNISFYAHNYNTKGYSKIYKIGTGFNGTIKGQFYGVLPNFYAPINNSLLYLSDDFIYVSDGDPFGLLKVNKFNGDTTRIILADGLLNWDNAKVQNGSFYLASDGNFVYNLASRDSLGNRRYILRTFNPKKHWSLAKADMQLSGTIYPGFSSFFVADGFIYPYENYQNGLMRRINISDGTFEEEWISYSPFQQYYSWCYDPTNNIVYASEFSNENGSSKIASFKGKYIDAIGNATTTEIGPAAKWNSLDFNIADENKSSSFKVSLFGKNTSTNKWDTLKTDYAFPMSMKFNESNKYNYIKLGFTFWDSSFTSSSSINLKSVFVNYTSLPDISLIKDEMILSQDSVLQGVPVNINLILHNYGLSIADSVKLGMFLNSNNFPFFSKTVSIPSDSAAEFSTTIQTDNLSSANIIMAVAELPAREFFTFNNSVSKSLYIIKDSANPSVSVTFDGREILDGDIVSAKPVIVLTIKDNSIQQIDTSNFKIVLDSHPIIFSGDDVKFAITSHPFRQIEIEWTPLLADGMHRLSINVKNALGNFSDSLNHKIQFYTFKKSDIQNIFNYPNPFQDNTNFTFQLTGSNIPEEVLIQIFTVAGRFINAMSVPSSALQIGYNIVPWNGRDKEGNIIANGVYFYKITVKNNGIVKSVIQKLVKVK